MKILLRLAMLALCSAAGILLAVKLAATQPKPEAAVAEIAPAPQSEVVAAASEKSSANPPEKVIADRAVEKSEIAAAAKSSSAWKPAASRNSESSGGSNPVRTAGSFTPKLPRKQALQPRIAQQFPDLGLGAAPAAGSSGNTIADSERMLMQVQQQLQQARDSQKAAVQAVGANPTSDPAALMMQILGQGGLPANNAATGNGSVAPEAERLNQLLKLVQGAQQPNDATAQAAPAGAVPAPPNPALPAAVLQGAPVAAPPAEALPKPPAISPAGDGKLSIHSRDDDLRILLEQLGEQAGLNILACQSVAGTITVSLNDVSVDEALAVVLKISGFLSRREGNVVYIGTAADFAALEKVHDRVTTRVYRPNYLTAKELANLLTPLITPGTGKISVTSPPAMGIGTDTTSAGGDSLAQQDAVVIQDYENTLIQIDQVIKELDRRPAQVSIEAVIISVTLDDQNDFGVDFQVLRDKNNVRFGWGNPRINPLNGGGAVDPNTGGVNGEFKFDTGGLKFAFLDDSLGVFINALETVGDANIVASPKLLCLNKQKAEILIGQRLGYISTTVTQTYSTQNVEFLDVGTQLRLRPYISSDGLIRMEVHPELSTGAVQVQGGFTLPNKTLTEVTTNVMCPDGCTVIIGGLMREELTTDITQVPLLGSLPIAGPLFRNKTDNVARTEILVLLTPRIIYDEHSTTEGERSRRQSEDVEAAKFHRMSPLGRAHLARDYLLRANKALQEGKRHVAERYARLAVHYDPLNVEAVELYKSLTGGDIVHPMVKGGLGATVVVGEDEALLGAPAVDGETIPQWMLNDLGAPPGAPAVPALPLHPRDPGVPGAVIDIQRPQVFRNDK